MENYECVKYWSQLATIFGVLGAAFTLPIVSKSIRSGLLKLSNKDLNPKKTKFIILVLKALDFILIIIHPFMLILGMILSILLSKYFNLFRTYKFVFEYRIIEYIFECSAILTLVLLPIYRTNDGENKYITKVFVLSASTFTTLVIAKSIDFILPTIIGLSLIAFTGLLSDSISSKIEEIENREKRFTFFENKFYLNLNMYIAFLFIISSLIIKHLITIKFIC